MTENRLLDLQNVVKRFGGLLALDDLSLSVEQSEVLGLIGPNGAGKSTTLNVISGVYDVTEGTIEYRGEDITDEPPHEIATRGLVRTFQEARHFENENGFENIRTGMITNDLFAVETYFSAIIQDETSHRQRVYEAAETVELSHAQLQKQPSDMTHLERKKLSIARAIVGSPEMVMLDEPLAGLSSEEMDSIGDVVRKLNETGMTIIIIDHNVSDVMDLADRVVVLDQGSVLEKGSPEAILDNDHVQRAYFGE